MDQINQDRVLGAITQKNGGWERMFPELIPAAVDIIKNEQVCCEKHPEDAARWQEICQVKLDNLIPNLLAGEIMAKQKEAKKVQAREVKTFAKDKSFEKYIDYNNMQLDATKLRRTARSLSRDQAESLVRQVCNDFNSSIPALEEIGLRTGATLSAKDKALVDQANELARKHNALVLPLQHKYRNVAFA